jgi:hypothetical protein
MNITATEIIAEVHRLAEANPKNRYLEADCYYTRGACSNGSSGCIVGQALSALGYGEKLAHLDDERPQGILRVASLLGITGEQDQLDWLETVQDWQDRGDTWCDAVARAEAECLTA